MIDIFFCFFVFFFFLQLCRDEELLGRGLELNDSLQTVLAKHDALASGSSGSVLPTQSRNLSLQRPESSAATQKVSEVRGSSLRDSSPPPNVNNSSSTASLARRPIEEDDEEEDEFVQLARRLVMIGCQVFIFIHHR